MTEAAAEASSEDVAEKDEEKEKETERPVNFFFEQISWSPAMPKFMTSLPKLESQKQRKRTLRSSSKGKAAQLLLRPFFRRRAAMP